MKAYLLASLFLVVGCGADPLKSDHFESSIPLMDAPQYIAKFEALARVRLNRPDYKVTSTVQMVPHLRDAAGKAVGGICHPDTQVIGLNATQWDFARGGDVRESVIFHELGHCELFRPHLDTLRADGTKTSLMNSQGLYEEGVYDGNQDYYHTELFSIELKQCDALGTCEAASLD